MRKRITSILLCAALLLGILPVGVVAAGAETVCTDWVLGENWSYDPATGTLAQTAVTGTWNTWTQSFSTENCFEISTDIHYTTTITAENYPGDIPAIFIRDYVTGNYLVLGARTWQAASGQYYLYTTAQLWNASTASWSAEKSNWSPVSATPYTDAVFTVRYDKVSETFYWETEDKATGAVLSANSGGSDFLPEDFLTSTTLNLMLGSSNVGMVSYSNIRYVNHGDRLTLPVSFSGTDWIVSSTVINNTQSYTFSFDAKLPLIESVTAADTWADNLQLVIRNGIADDYILIQLQTYCNGGGGYQIAPSAMVWDGSATSWSDRDFLWSDSFSQPISDVHMDIAYDALTGTFSWTLLDNATGKVLNNHSFPASRITEELKTGTACELKFYRNPMDITVSNATLSYRENKAVEGILCTDWVMGENWQYNLAQHTLFQTGITGTWNTWTRSFSTENSFELSTDIHYTTDIAAENCPGDIPAIFVRDYVTGNYLVLGARTWQAASGQYYLYTTAQLWNAATASWSAEKSNWSPVSATPYTDSVFTVRYDKASKTFSWETVDKATGAVLSTNSGGSDFLPEDFLNSTTLNLMLGNSNTGMVEYSNMRYVELEADAPADPDALSFTGDGDWLTADKTVDHSKSFVVEYDVAYALVNTVAPGNWADDISLHIANNDDTHKVIFQTQAARGGETSYNLGISSTSILAGVASERSWFDAGWSTTPDGLNNIHLKYSYDATTRIYSWVITDNRSGNELHRASLPAGRVSDAMATNTAMNIRIYRNPVGIQVSNAKLYYVEDSAPEQVNNSIYIEGGDLPAAVTSVSVEGTTHTQYLDAKTWSYGKQLFYVASAPGETAVFRFDVDKAAEYTLLLRNTKAGDYGQYALYVDDVLLKDIDSYAATVAMESVDCGKVTLGAGTHSLKIVITGKNAASAGYYIGVDHIELLAGEAVSYPRTSGKWSLNTDWAVDDTDSSLILTKAAAAPLNTWNQTLNISEGMDLSSTWTIDGEISGNNKWGGVTQFLLRDPVSGDYLAMRFYRYRNGEGKYQVYSNINLWDESSGNWSNILSDVWGTKVDGSMLNELKLNIKHVKGSDGLIVTVSDTAETLLRATVNAASFTDSTQGAEFVSHILNNTAVNLMVDAGYDNTHTFRLSNPVITVPEVVLNTSNKWNLGTNWGVNNDDSQLVLTSNAAGISVWKETVDLSKGMNIATDWLIHGEIATNDTWGGGLELFLRDTVSGDYFVARFYRYRNGGGVYQIYFSAQMWDESGVQWSNGIADVWYTMPNGEIPKDLKIVLSRPADSDTLKITLSNNSGELSTAEISAASFTDSALGEDFVSHILRGQAVAYMVNAAGNNDRTYRLSNPEFYTSYYSFADIARRTWDMSYLATRPKAGEGGQLVSSYDRRSVYNEKTGEYLDWAANQDGFGYIRYENGYKVLADLEGPGYLTRIWFGWDYTGNVKIYLDGELTFDMPLVDFVRAFSDYDQLSYKANTIGDNGYYGSNMLLVPITYNKSCKILLEDGESNMFYYYVGYYNLEDGAAVEAFTWPMTEANAAALQEANNKLNDKTVPTGDSSFSEEVAPGETVTIYESETPAAITGWSMNLNIPEEELDDQASLAEWIVNIYWDGSDKPAVSMAVADYFGVIYGLYDRAFDSAAHGVTDDGILYTTWYMPFASAKVTLTNNSAAKRNVEASFATVTLTADQAAELTRFHGNWQRSYQGEDDRAPDAQFVYVEGEGRYVGTWLHVYQVVDNIWWGEGDEKIYIDGEKFPSWFGTGSEDYFGYTWGDGLLFNYAYYGQPIQESQCNYGAGLTVQQSKGDKVNYRIHVHDNITFTTSIEVMMEKYFNENYTKYGASSFFYLTPETSENHVSVAPTLEERLFNNDSAPGLTIEPDSSKTPADFGWQTNSNDFSGWLVSTDGSELYAAKDAVANDRIWKNIISDPENFSVELTVKIASGRVFVEIMGQTIELNCNGGNGGQIFDKESWEWFEALNQICTLTVTRAFGGDLQISFKGKCNSTPVTFTKPVVNDSDTNVYIRVPDAGSAVYFYNVKDNGVPMESVGVYGWNADDNDFSGWTTFKGEVIEAVYVETTGNQRIWKNLISDQNSYALASGLALETDSTASLKVQGLSFSFAYSGNSTVLSCNGIEKASFIDSELVLELSNENGTVTLVVKDKLGTVLAELTEAAAENSEAVELGVAAGKAIFSDLRVSSGLLSESAHWTLGDHWKANATDTKIVLQDTSALISWWKDFVGLAKGLTLTTTWELKDAEIANNGAMGGRLELFFRDVASGDYIVYRPARWKNDEGAYQLYISAQMWDESATQWSEFVIDSWYTAPATEDLKDITFTFRRSTMEDKLYLTASLPDGTVLMETVLGAEDFQNSQQGEDFVTNILNGTQTQYMTNAGPENNVLFSVTNPVITAEGQTNVDFDDNKTPADFGWSADSNDFGAWQTTTEGDVFYVDYNGQHSQKIWKDLLEDPENFTLTATMQIEGHRAYVQLLGVVVELDCSGGNGNQIFDKENWQWFDASGQICYVTFARVDGGDLTVKIQGRGNADPIVYAKKVSDPENENLIIGVYDTDGSAFFRDIIVGGLEDQSVKNFGWDTDEINGNKDFSGWTTLDGINIRASYAATTGNHRIWKGLMTDQQNFNVTVDYTADTESSAYVKILGQTIELDTRGGDGNQVGVKINGYFREWVSADGRTVKLILTRKGGNITVSIVGSDGIHNFSVTPSESNSNLELGIYAGTVNFANIHVLTEIIPFVKAVFAGDFIGEWTKELLADIIENQLCPLASETVALAALAETNGDLVIVAYGLEDLLNGKNVAEFKSDYAGKLTALQNSDKTVVLTGIPYVADAALGNVTIETYAAYNAAIREIADTYGFLYADLYAAMGDRAWTVKEDGKSLSAVGNSLVAGEIIEELMRACPNLALNTNYVIDTDHLAEVEKTDAALESFKTASTAATLQALVENKALGFSVELYRSLSNSVQAQVITSLLNVDRSGLINHEEANALFLKVCMEISRVDLREEKAEAPFDTYVAVGDSITDGVGAVIKTDNWVFTLGDLISGLQGSELTTIDNGISGTRMCTVTENGVFPPAKDTVQEYIVTHQPDLVTVSYGINDYHAGTSYDEFIRTYRGYLSELKTSLPDATVVILGLGAKGNNDESSADIILWNAGIKALAEEFDYIYADTYHDLRGVEWLLVDGLHPSNAGYRVMANAVLRTLNGFVDLTAEAQPMKTPGDFGWESDSEDFSGWTATDEANLSVTYAQTVNGRVWKGLLSDLNNFTIDLDVTNDNSSSTYIKVLGVIIELDSNNGSGNQTFMKLGGVNYDWLAGNSCKFHVTIARSNGGDLTVTVTGEGNETPFTATASPTENNENVELGLYRGISKFENITVVSGEAEPTEIEIKMSHTVSFDSDLQMNYRIKLADILAAVPNYVTEGAYLTVEKDRYPMGGGAMTVETVTLYPDLTTDAERMLFNLAGIQSVEMGSELRAVLHFFDENGNEYCTTVDTYSVLAYAELCFDYYDPATDGYLFTMLIDCLNYGSAAQVAFDRRADELVNAGLEAYQQYASTELSAELTDVRTYVDNDRTITAVTAMGFTVTFADKTEINAKLTIAEGYTKADITSVKVLNENGEVVDTLTEFTELDDGRLQVTFTGMKSVDMRNMYYFVAYVGDQVASQNVGYSIEAYAKSNIASTDANAANLAKACIYYGDSAKVYFDSLIK